MNHIHKSLRICTILALIMTPLMFFNAVGVSPVQAAATIVVNTDSDIDIANSVCSLREAIIAAEANANYHGCTGTGAYGADTITFAANYTITLAGSPLPWVSSEITISGNGATNTIIQANADPGVATYHVFRVVKGNLTLEGLTVRNGGGGIYKEHGTLTVTNSTFSGNSARDGGIINKYGTLTVTNSTFFGNSANLYGGGIYNYGTGVVTVTNSTFSGNSADIGGGIFNEGTLMVTNSTFSGNAARYGGGIHTETASGTCADPSAVVIANSTFIGNSASYQNGGIENSNGVITLLFNTIAANNGGGVYSHNNSTTCTKIGSNIIAGNTGYDVRAEYTAQRFYSLDHNLIGVAGGSVDFTQEFNQPYDQVNVADPMLGTLANNGGLTETVALLPGSPAIGWGEPVACAASPINNKDQRGVARPQGQSCDTGAFEFATQSGRNLIVNSNADSDDGLCESFPGGCTLREAINAANAISGLNALTFAGNYTITLAGSQLPSVSSEITITGNGAVNTFIQANANPQTASHRVFEVTNTGDLTLVGLTVRNGLCTGSCEGSQNGGGIRNSGVLMVTNSTVSGNSAENGGGIYNFGGGTLTVTNSTFSGNSASRGGGINNNLGTLTVTSSTFSGNSGSYGGGSIYNATATGTCTSSSASTISNSTFSGNSADDGGGIYNYNGVITLRFNTITTNSSGGGVFSYNSSTTCTKAGSNIIASNTGYDVGAYNTTQRFYSLGYNLIGVANANVDFNQEFNQAHDQVNVSYPLLGPLANNGGPTLTHALLEGSPAMEAGDDANCPATDQRGETRPYGMHCDVGAFELHGAAAPPSVPALISPANNFLTTNYTPTLDWSNSTHAAGVIFDHYQLQVGRDAGFENLVKDVNIAGVTNSNYTFPAALTTNVKYYWRVRSANLGGVTSNWSLVRTFRTALTPPMLVSPANGFETLTPRPTFDWEDVSGAAGYTIQISKNNTFTSIVHSGSPAASTYTPAVDLPRNLTLYWRVQTRGTNGPSLWSVEARSFLSANSPGTPVPSVPANNSLNKNYLPLFKWSAVTLPANTTFKNYQLQVDDNPDFSSLTINDTSITNRTTIQFQAVTPLVHNTRFYWRVRAVNTDNEVGNWSAVRYFRTQVDAPTLVAPLNGYNALTLRPFFSWAAPAGSGVITGYTLQVSRNNTFTAIVNAGSPVGSEYTSSVNLPRNMTLYWRVLTRGANGPSAWSEVRSFVSANAPTTPVLSLPALNALNTTYTPLFKWSAVTVSAPSVFKHYQLQVDDNVDFSSPVINDISITNRLTVQFQVVTPLTHNTKFYWRVRAVNTDDEVGNWSAVRYFRTIVDAPTLLTPANGTPAGTLKPVFDWQDAVAPITGYTIQVSASPSFGTLLVSSITVESTYSMIKNLPAGKTLYWRVRVNGPNGPSAWSSTFSFTTP